LSLSLLLLLLLLLALPLLLLNCSRNVSSVCWSLSLNCDAYWAILSAILPVPPLGGFWGKEYSAHAGERRALCQI
jgi:hypothetical protein